MTSLLAISAIVFGLLAFIYGAIGDYAFSALLCGIAGALSVGAIFRETRA